MSTFDDHEVAYLVVGAHSIAGHGFPRATGGIELSVEPTPDNAARVYDALVEFGAPASHFDKEDFTAERSRLRPVGPRRGGYAPP